MVTLNTLLGCHVSGQDSNVAPAKHKSESIQNLNKPVQFPITVNGNYTSRFEIKVRFDGVTTVIVYSAENQIKIQVQVCDCKTEVQIV
jgi:hypothetical protein